MDDRPGFALKFSQTALGPSKADSFESEVSFPYHPLPVNEKVVHLMILSSLAPFLLKFANPVQQVADLFLQGGDCFSVGFLFRGEEVFTLS